MRSRANHIVLGLAAAILASASTAKSDAAAPSGASYRHPLGFTLPVPSGWRVASGADGSLQLIPKDQGAIEGYLVTAEPAGGITSVDSPRGIQSIESDLLPLFPFLERVQTAETIATGLGAGTRLAWEGESPTGVVVRAETYVVITGGRAVALVAIGPKERIASRRAVLRQLFAGFGAKASSVKVATTARSTRAAGSRARATRPARVSAGSDTSAPAKSWRQRLGGKKLTYMSSYSSGSSGGYNSRYDITLAPNGTFVYRGNSSVSIYVSGADGSSVSQEAKEGSWRIVSRGGQAILELMPSGGKLMQYALASQDGKTYLNGARFFVTDP